MKFHPGEINARTGVFRVIHYRHRFSHDVLVLEGDLFPRCHKCGELVRFESIHAHEAENPISSVLEDLDFRATA